VSTDESKAGARMIKGELPFPVVDGVAALAVLAEATVMRILFCVTGGARSRRAAIMRIVAMAASATGFGVPAHQWIVRQRVIEPGAAEPNQHKTAAVMIAMTNLARLAPAGRLAMEATTPLHIGRDPAVAAEAFGVLGFARKRLVAGLAVCFEFGVRIAQRAGCDQPLHNGLRHQSLSRKDQADDDEQAPPKSHQYMCTATMCSTAAQTSSTNSGKCNRCHSRSRRS